VEVTEVDAVAEVNWLTITEAAAVMGVSPSKAREMADAGELDDPVLVWRVPPRGDRRVHPDSAERKRQELQGKK
jgi:predicted transcriptional regulator of viral defense system